MTRKVLRHFVKITDLSCKSSPLCRETFPLTKTLSQFVTVVEVRIFARYRSFTEENRQRKCL